MISKIILCFRDIRNNVGSNTLNERKISTGSKVFLWNVSWLMVPKSTGPTVQALSKLLKKIIGPTRLWISDIRVPVLVVGLNLETLTFYVPFFLITDRDTVVLILDNWRSVFWRTCSRCLNTDQRFRIRSRHSPFSLYGRVECKEWDLVPSESEKTESGRLSTSGFF